MSDTELELARLWHLLRERLATGQLLEGIAPALSLRVPGTDAMWFGEIDDQEPSRTSWQNYPGVASAVAIHSRVYAARDDVCAVATGGGRFGLALADFGGTMPGVFDEQVRHLGRMPPPAITHELPRALALKGNVLLVNRQPLVMGMTGARLALNAELFEKCAKAYVLATASAGRVKPLPWIVRYVANRRLARDEGRARLRVLQGLLPEESKGY
ncbi:hypothetical protein [Paraburkholderia ferrariae]|uniref:hypothetical protein n=1 Tax=Paraburkholderia ferrariae TaxID=386056 RepID=UPI00048428D0|nr:hypothetical protein [Paraburkholderia ferrariae]